MLKIMFSFELVYLISKYMDSIPTNKIIKKLESTETKNACLITLYIANLIYYLIMVYMQRMLHDFPSKK